MTRIVEIPLAMVALIVISPLLAAAGLAVLVTDGRPILFRHERVGRNGIRFDVLKFRTMRADASGPSITSSSDARVTPIGRILRDYKLDELMQLFNVVRGDMSLVGPRPEVAAYVDDYPDLFAPILKVRPGITDPSSIQYRNEERILGSQPDPDAYYRSTLLPRKIATSADYLSRRSFRTDVGVILATARSIFE